MVNTPKPCTPSLYKYFKIDIMECSINQWSELPDSAGFKCLSYTLVFFLTEWEISFMALSLPDRLDNCSFGFDLFVLFVGRTLSLRLKIKPKFKNMKKLEIPGAPLKYFNDG